jgi:nitrogen fixation protein NifU and related proteins
LNSNLDALYQEVILDHNRKPRNFRPMEDADRVVDGKNPLCGDEIKLFLKLDGDRIADLSFQTPPGVGCAISKASASLMTTALKGKPRAEAEELFERFHRMVTGKLDEDERKQMGSLGALGGVSKFPVRVKCASLAWHALKSALDGSGAEISTEHIGPPPTEGA